MNHRQITPEERYTIARLRFKRYRISKIAEILGRHRSTIYRELERNSCNDGMYRAFKADSRTRARRRECRRKWYFTNEELQMVIALIRLDWSPEQVSGWLKEYGILSISHTTIYRYVWYDFFYGGTLYQHLRQANKKRRKRNNSLDSRGIMRGKRHISERPKSAENKSRIGHWEIDTVIGSRDDTHCIVTLVERKTKYTLIGKLPCRTTTELNEATIKLINQQRRFVRTITADNGTEFHGFKEIEKLTGTEFYFANPYHSWERGLNENTNGLIRQYLPKGKSMANITQKDCNRISEKLNKRPRKLLNYKTPEQCYVG